MPWTITIVALRIPWKKDSFIDLSKAILFSSYKVYWNFYIKNLERPKDFTVLMLLTVSEIRQPMNFSERYDLRLILLTTDMWMKLTIISRGEQPTLIRPIFQQCTIAMTKAHVMAVELRHTTAMIPVRTL
jgi:hypothetical protein